MGGVDGIWPPSGHEEVPGLNDGAEFSTRSAQEIPSGPPPDPEFPHFSNVPSGTTGGFFKARQRGNPHNVLPGTVQGRSQGGFLDMNESPLPSHPLPRPSTSRTFSAERTSKPSPATHATLPPHTLPRNGPSHCPNSSPRHMHEYAQDAIAYVRLYGCPYLFITFTCNPAWDDIQQLLLEMGNHQ
ncbi:hypothetical protein TNCT_245701 [Trichonephila clavata]|uniref:Helitron helicase-like domain-containing protein n=1 Tax=Trichonephila clavata TaxID=2740835 RepID=A0A8X6JEG2_TRICU|nr:hypothetical protein TNCT_245701 [Trichonephila clavata]